MSIRSGNESYATQNLPTQLAPDVGDSALYLGLFHASAESCTKTKAEPVCWQVTQTIGP